MEESKFEYVFVIKLKVPMSHYWYGNPSIKKLIIPLRGEDAYHLRITCAGFVYLPLPIYGNIYWWMIKRVEIWENGKLIFSKKNPQIPQGE